jgi:hypothetical protein
VNALRSFWAWLRPATPDPADGFDDVPRPGSDEQWADMPRDLDRFNEPELSEQDRREIAAETLDDRRRDAAGEG